MPSAEWSELRSELRSIAREYLGTGYVLRSKVRRKRRNPVRTRSTPRYVNADRQGADYAAVLCPAGFVRERTVRYYLIPGGRLRHFRLDFAHFEAKVNIEIDGTSHADGKSKERDARRDAILRALGWRVIRIRE